MKRKSKSKTSSVTSSKPKTAKPATPTQEELQITWQLKGNLKNAQLAYLRVGALLTKVRDKNLYSELKHPSMEDYAAKRLQLGKTSLYRYLQVYAWVGKNHPEWLQPKVQGLIPDLSDIADLIWAENELSKKTISTKKRTTLESLKTKAMNGTLRKGEIDHLRRREGKTKDSLKSFLSKLRNLRMRGSQLASMPSEVITHLDAAIAILKNEQPVAQCGFERLEFGRGTLLA